MIVPQYWAEASVRMQRKRRQVTVRRFGWSDVSQAEAQASAEARAREAVVSMEAGQRLSFRERKVSYNGAEGLPIREEVISRHGDTVVTRNTYGARCLNTPNVLFADIDFPRKSGGAAFLILFVLALIGAVAVGGAKHAWLYGLATFMLDEWIGHGLKRYLDKRKAPEAIAQAEKQCRDRVEQFIKSHPAWHVRVYRTPAGLRVLAMHRVFDPAEPEVAECFRELGTDLVYVTMCSRQKCFRARVSPKPWRIGISQHIRPRPGIWPVNPEKMPLRQTWVDQYEKAAVRFSSCRFLTALGNRTLVDPAAQAVQALHDQLCQANTSLPLG